MLVERFLYQKLKREHIDGKRYYCCPDGYKYASVTTILAATKSESDKQSLQNWKNNMGHVRAASITQEAGLRGTKMHSYIEKYIQTGDIGIPGSNPFAQQSHKMAKHIIDNGLKNISEFYGVEIGLHYPGLYAGTADIVAEYEGELVIIDLKQSNKPKKEIYLEDYRCQLCAYIISHNELFNTNITRGINMICTPDLQYQQFEIDKSNFNYYSDLWLSRVENYYNLCI